MRSSPDLGTLCEMARSYGASDAAVLESRDIVLDPRVKLKCMVPQCANYGRNLMCPPNVMGMDDFSEVLERYTRSILVQYPIPMDTEFMSKFSGSSIEDIYETGEYEERMTKSERQFQDLLGKLESDALNMGCRFAAAFTGGPCRLCDECVGQGSGPAILSVRLKKVRALFFLPLSRRSIPRGSRKASAPNSTDVRSANPLRIA